MRQLILNLFFCTVVLAAFAQNPLPETDADKDFDRAIDLFERDQYLASRTNFERYLQDHVGHYRNAEAQYYIAFNAINQGQKDAEFLMNNFIENNSAHPQAIYAYFDLGNHYFNQGKYKSAIKYYEKADFSRLSSATANQGRFQLGYSYFSISKDDGALSSFGNVRNSTGSYFEDAQYYSGTILYSRGSYQDALQKLLQAEKSAKYKDETPEMVASSYLALKQYDDLLRYIVHQGNMRIHDPPCSCL